MTTRCDWARVEPMISYHDTEWGVPEHDERKLFEFLCLEGAQAGLSWMTILKRRQGYRDAFSNFDAGRISGYGQSDIKELLQNRSIIRNRSKILSAINNAKRFLAVQEEFGSFDRYVWAFVNHKPIKNRFKRHSQIPAYTDLSEHMSADLKRRGFTFVGPTICYAFMQAVGMVNDHTVGCFARSR